MKKVLYTFLITGAGIVAISCGNKERQVTSVETDSTMVEIPEPGDTVITETRTIDSATTTRPDSTVTTPR